jgi:transcription initiation factor TFIIF subunit alpha
VTGAGDDWEHEETFTDDDEAVGNDPEEREEAPEGPAPPEIKQVFLVSMLILSY